MAGGYKAYGAPQSTPSKTDVFDSTEIYDISSDVWSAGPTLPAKRLAGTAITIRNRHLWIGGKSESTNPVNVVTVTNVWEYKPDSVWSITNMTLKATASIPVVIPYNL